MKSPLCLAATCLLLGCAGAVPYNVTHKKHDSLTSPYTTDTMYFYRDIMYKVGLVRVGSDKSAYTNLEIQYHGPGWLFMDGKVMVKIDGELHVMQDPKPIRVVAYRGVDEIVSVHVSDALLEAMRDGKVVGIQFFAEPIYVNDAGRRNIGQFYDDYVVGRKSKK